MTETEQRWFDIPAVLLFMMTLWLIGLRIQVTDWTESLSLVQFAMILGAVIGLTLGSSMFNKPAVIWMTAAFSLISLTWFFTMLMPSEMIWAEKLIGLSQQIRISLGHFIRNESIRGSELFMTSLIFTFWWLGLITGYQLTRTGKPWIPLGVLFITFLVIDYYPPVVRSRYVYSGMIVLLLSLLMGRLYFLQSQVRWKEKRAMVDFGAGYDISRGFVISALLLVSVAWGIPGVVRMLTPGTKEQQKFVDFWDPLQERFANVVSELKAPRTASADFFGKSLSLGTEISTDETPVFRVSASAARARGFRYYWRGYSYDKYENGGWSNTIEDYTTLKPSDWPQPLPDWDAHQKVELTYTWLYPRSRILYIPGNPLSVSRPVDWISESNTDGHDGISIIASSSVYKDETVDAEAWVSVPTAFDLQMAGQDYPEWITQRYLQLPEDLPESIPGLAMQITAGIDNPFEKVQAVTQYLRENIQYNGIVEAAPSSEDPVAWFLFETKEGFCNYYASAEVLLLRSLGIPARMTVGFVQGEEQEESNTYLVKLKHAHAWPEVYFPGIGWVEFEPTVIQTPPELYYENFSQMELGPNAYEGLNENLFERYGMGRFEEYAGEGVYDELLYLPKIYYPWREWGIFAAVLLMVGFIFWFQKFSTSPLYDRRLPVLLENLLQKRGWGTPDWLRFLSNRAALSPIGRYFSEIPWMLRLLGVDLSPGQTPSEQVNILIEKLPETRLQASILLREYEIFSFSSHPSDLERARQAHSRLWVQVVLARIKKLLQR
ncbi:MAG: DUF3488 and transglutaminase-like domain-containing protein [Chloroflexi bacterium]|nr:DUF3488 and transglutaminase-like domain-containing protein [Chloroflexota bacterium]